MCGIGLSPPNPLKIHRERKKKSRWGERKHKTCLFPGSTMLKKCTFLVMVSLVPAGSAVSSLYMSQVIRYQSHLSSHQSDAGDEDTVLYESRSRYLYAFSGPQEAFLLANYILFHVIFTTRFTDLLIVNL